MRERPVTCRNATPVEWFKGRHMTWNDSAICSRCSADSRRRERDGGQGAPPAVLSPAFSPAGASRPATHLAPVGDHP